MMNMRMFAEVMDEVSKCWDVQVLHQGLNIPNVCHKGRASVPDLVPKLLEYAHAVPDKKV